MCKELFECLTSLNCIEGFIGLCALSITFWEYHQYRERNKADILGKFNERYSSNSDIKDVITFIEECLKDLPQDEIKGEIKNETKAKIKANIDTVKQIKIDLFFRFFEEIQLAIEAKSLNEEDVYNLFYYYAEKGKKLSLLSDYPTEWCILERFYNRMELHNKINHK
ncbi:MAG: hypothetical protein IJY31_00465 [Muribaculaceae bacterium]|nr:hypothetical protein [Muribaculaceae bacterium]